MPRLKLQIFATTVAAFVVISTSTLARTLEVGPLQELKVPSDAAALAENGDIVIIDQGEYTDCAVWNANNLTIEGKGDVIIQDQVCRDEAIFVISGSNITIRAIEFAHAKSSNKNGAGIRADGTDLTVEDSRFIDNENGILTSGNPQSHIIIHNSVFRGNGICDTYCAHGIYIGHIALLQVFGSTFIQQYEGHHIKSRALQTEIIGNTIKDGPVGTASYAVDIPDGGSLIMRHNVIEKGPNAENRLAAVSIGEESQLNPTDELTIDHNSFINDNAVSTTFVRNMTTTTARLVGNELHGKVVPVTGPGIVSP